MVSPWSPMRVTAQPIQLSANPCPKPLADRHVPVQCPPTVKQGLRELSLMILEPGPLSLQAVVPMAAALELEKQQNASRDSWTFEHTEIRLADIMGAIHERCVTTADAYCSPGNYVAGANVAGFIQVADAMLALGVV